jgi:hypothetical protein
MEVKMNLLRHIDIEKATTAHRAPSTFYSTVIDMANAEGCLFIAIGSTLCEGSSKITLAIQGSTASSSGFVTYSGNVSSTAIVTGSGDYRMLALDLYRPEKQYVRAKVTGSSSGAVGWDTILAIKYGVRRPGSSAINDSTKLAGSTVLVSPSS